MAFKFLHHTQLTLFLLVFGNMITLFQNEQKVYIFAQNNPSSSLYKIVYDILNNKSEITRLDISFEGKFICYI